MCLRERELYSIVKSRGGDDDDEPRRGPPFMRALHVCGSTARARAKGHITGSNSLR